MGDNFFQDRYQDFVMAEAFTKIARQIERIDRRMAQSAASRVEMAKAIQKLAADRAGATAPATPEQAMAKLRYGF